MAIHRIVILSLLVGFVICSTTCFVSGGNCSRTSDAAIVIFDLNISFLITPSSRDDDDTPSSSVGVFSGLLCFCDCDSLSDDFKGEICS